MGKVALARIDERLIHGQVMTNLSKHADFNSIFIADDAVSQDDFMKSIFVSAGSRTGLQVKIMSLDEIVNYWETKEFETCQALLLVKNVAAIYELAKRGIPMRELNLGGIAKKPGTEYIIKAVAINKEQGEILKEMRDGLGVKDIYFQTVPSSKKVSLDEALKIFKI